MSAPRSTYDPVSRHLATGERVVWRHQPDSRVLFYNRLPAAILVLVMTMFVVFVGWNVVTPDIPLAIPQAPSFWLLIPLAGLIFFLVLIYSFASSLWSYTAFLLASANTHYALTDRRFMVVSGRGATAYDASYFHKMEPTGGEPGKQTLLFDWGPGRKGGEHYRERIAALPDAEKLAQLIRATLRPQA